MHMKLFFKTKHNKTLASHALYKGQEPDSEYVSKIINLKKPENEKEIERMDGIINWLAKYIPHLSQKIEPINKLRKKKQKWIWGEELLKLKFLLKRFLDSSSTFNHDNFLTHL